MLASAYLAASTVIAASRPASKALPLAGAVLTLAGIDPAMSKAVTLTIVTLAESIRHVEARAEDPRRHCRSRRLTTGPVGLPVSIRCVEAVALPCFRRPNKA